MSETITADHIQRLWAADPSDQPVLVIRDGAVTILAEQDVTDTDMYVAARSAYQRWLSLAPGWEATDQQTLNAYAQELTDVLADRAGRRILTVTEWARATGISAGTIWHALGSRSPGRPEPAGMVVNAALYSVGLVRWMRSRRSGRPMATEMDERIRVLLRRGRSQREIAEELGVAIRTVEWRLRRLRARTGMTTAQLAQPDNDPTHDHAQ